MVVEGVDCGGRGGGPVGAVVGVGTLIEHAVDSGVAVVGIERLVLGAATADAARPVAEVQVLADDVDETAHGGAAEQQCTVKDQAEQQNDGDPRREAGGQRCPDVTADGSAGGAAALPVGGTPGADVDDREHAAGDQGHAQARRRHPVAAGNGAEHHHDGENAQHDRQDEGADADQGAEQRLDEVADRTGQREPRGARQHDRQGEDEQGRAIARSLDGRLDGTLGRGGRRLLSGGLHRRLEVVVTVGLLPALRTGVPRVNGCNLIRGVPGGSCPVLALAAPSALHLRIIRDMVLHHIPAVSAATAATELAGQARHAARGLRPRTGQPLPDCTIGAAGALEIAAVPVVHASGGVTGGSGARGPMRRAARGGARPGAAGAAGG